MRLITRGDLDGLTCAVIISSNEKIDQIKLIHPQDITDKRIEVTKNDILANVPYDARCGKWFDHHILTDNNPKPPEKFDGAYGLAPSAARLVYDYYGGEAKMPGLATLVKETDRLDSAQLTPADVTDPQGHILLGYTIDNRTGLGAFEDYFLLLVDLLKKEPITAVLDHPLVKQRWERIKADERTFLEVTKKHSRLDGNVVITDFRPLSTLPIGNRFLIYTLFPQANVSLRIHWGPQQRFVVAAVGHSIFNRTCRTNVGELMGKYGGGGHKGAGTAPLAAEKAGAQLEEIIATLKRNG
jgi:hypothetical protein